MTWIDFIWPMVTGACLTLGLFNLRIALAERPRAARLLFSLSAFLVAVISVMELALMRAGSPARYEALLPWADIATWAMLTSLAAFVWVFFGAGNKWLGLAGSAVYGAGLFFYVGPGPGLIYLKITGLKTVETYGGATFRVVEGVPNPWVILTYSGTLLVLCFVVDASLQLRRRGNRRRAAIVGGSVVFFILVAVVHSALIERGLVHSPYLISWFYLAIMMAMAHELTTDVFAATKLGRELRESRERMSLAAESARLSMWEWDTARDEIWMTDEGRAMYGFEPDALIDFALLSERVHPEDRAARDAAIRRAVETESSYETEFRLLLADGSVKWIAARGRYAQGDRSSEKRLLGVSMDITGQKQADAETRRQREELAHLSRVALMGEVAASLAHELSQPLAAVANNASAGRRFIARGRADFPKLDELFACIAEDGQRAGEIVRGIRSMVQKAEAVRRPVALGQVIEDTLRLTKADVNARRCTLIQEVAEGLPPVNADAVQLQQVLLNLIINACEAMRDILPERRRVLIRAEHAEDRRVRVSVCDFGPGLPSENPQRIFEQFFSTKREGMGMGLAIARGIVDAHGGELLCANADDGGALLYFSLPSCGANGS